MYKYFFLLFYFFSITFCSYSQTSFASDPEVEALLKESVDHIYSTDTEQLALTARKVERRLPNHPVNFMIKAMSIRAAAYPIDPQSEEFEQMRTYLKEAARLSEEMLEDDPNKAEAHFFALASLGLLAMYENDAGNTLRALGYAKDSYAYLKRGFELKEKFPEFYMSTGLYNYYRVKYPEVRPVYQPFTWFFRDGDIKLGLEQLDEAYRRSIFMRPESAAYLSHIYLHYEDQPQKALPYARDMAESYPQNLSFVVSFLEASIASEIFAGLDKRVKQLKNSQKPYFKMTGQLFEAMLLEKRDRRWEEAERLYARAIETGKQLNTDEAQNYRSYAYAGLARTAIAREEHEKARNFYEKALAEARYPLIEKEAKAYLE
ncbi:MAG: tetratricopeptide repeat protein [Cyclobacteriaceae bacterium]